jgi:hypothetical protein
MTTHMHTVYPRVLHPVPVAACVLPVDWRNVTLPTAGGLQAQAGSASILISCNYVHACHSASSKHLHQDGSLPHLDPYGPSTNANQRHSSSTNANQRQSPCAAQPASKQGPLRMT